MARAPSARRGFSVIELLIALAILSVVMTAFIYGMVGRRTESVKSSAYFNAVWVTQKLCDDLDHRARENPYAVEELAERPAAFDLLDPGSVFFRFLEDGNGNLRLGDDATLGELKERQRRELAPYRVAVKLDRAAGNGLARARIAVSWDEKGRRQEYALDHLVVDEPSRLSVDEGKLERPAVTDAYLVAAFFDKPGKLDDLLREFGVNRDVLVALGEIQFASRTLANELVAIDKRIAARRAAADAWSVEGLSDMADLHEQAALATLKTYAALAPTFDHVRVLLEGGGPSFGTLFMNARARAILADLARLADRTLGHVNGACLAARFNADLASAFNFCVRIAGENTVAATASYRRRAAAGRRAVDYALSLAQNGADSMRVEFDGRTVPLEGHLVDSLAALKARAENRDYNRADFLGRVIASIRGKDFRPTQDISKRLGNMNAVAGLASTLLARITDLVGSGGFF